MYLLSPSVYKGSNICKIVKCFVSIYTGNVLWHKQKINWNRVRYIHHVLFYIIYRKRCVLWFLHTFLESCTCLTQLSLWNNSLLECIGMNIVWTGASKFLWIYNVSCWFESLFIALVVVCQFFIYRYNRQLLHLVTLYCKSTGIKWPM